MVEWIAAVIAIALAMVLLPWLMCLLPRPKRGGGVGNALQEIDALFNPGAPRHVEARQHPVKPSPPKADPPDGPPTLVDAPRPRKIGQRRKGGREQPV